MTSFLQLRVSYAKGPFLRRMANSISTLLHAYFDFDISVANLYANVINNVAAEVANAYIRSR